MIEDIKEFIESNFETMRVKRRIEPDRVDSDYYRGVEDGLRMVKFYI